MRNRVGFAAWLDHLVPMVTLTAILLAAVAYPLRLHEDILGRLEETTGLAGWLFQTQLRPLFAYTLSPLVLKETLASCLLIVMSYTWLILRVFRLGRESDQNLSPMSWRARIRRGAARPEPWIVGLILYATASSLPSGGEEPGWFFRTPSPIYSLKTLLPMSLGLMLSLVLLHATRLRFVTGKFMGGICLAAALITVISLLQHVEVQSRWWFMPQWANEPRNRIGSLIGHNTGLSSWLLFPLSFSIFYVLTGRRIVTRVLGAGLAMLIGFVLVAGQSRAVWALAVVGLPIYLILQFRTLRIRPPAWVWLAAVAAALAIVASQVVAPERNPLARHTVTLTQRLTTDVFNLDQLLRETRLRVFRASAPLIAQRPLLGHGLGAFQWVYPPAQGRYFSEGLGSVTGFTTRRTNVAHTDYVQLLIELGLVGVVLAAVPLVLMTRMALQGRRRASVHDRARIDALLFPVAVVALHAWIDFPMHIMPIALASIGAFSLAAGTGRNSGDASNRIHTLADASGTASTWGATPVRRPRTGHVVALSAAGFALVLGGLMTVFVARMFVSDIHYVDGSNWINTANLVPEAAHATRYDYLLRARKELRKATHVDPSNGEAYEKLAYTSGLLGETLLRLANEQTRRGGEVAKVKEMRERARLHYEAAVQTSILQLVQGELRWHYTYYLIGQAYRSLWKLDPDPTDVRQSNYLAAARANLERAIEYNIADPASLMELADLLDEQPVPEPARANRLRGLIHRVAPEFAASQYHDPALQAAERGDFATAWKRLARAEATAPSDPRLALVRGQISLRSALWPPPELDTDPPTSATLEYSHLRLEGVRAVLEKVSARPGSATSGQIEWLRMHHAAAVGDYPTALASADQVIKDRVGDRSTYILRWMLAKALGQQRHLPRELTGTAESEKYRHRFRMLYFGEKATGAVQLSNLAASRAVSLEISEGMRAAAYLKTLGMWDRVLLIAQNLAQAYPGDPDVQALLGEATQQIQSVSRSEEAKKGA